MAEADARALGRGEALTSYRVLVFQFPLKRSLNVENRVAQHVVCIALDGIVNVLARNAVSSCEFVERASDGGLCCEHVSPEGIEAAPCIAPAAFKPTPAAR